MTTLRDLVQPFVPNLRSVIIFFFVVYIPLYLFSITFFGRRTRRSPFHFPSILRSSAEPELVLSEKRRRDAVLRQYFNVKRVPERVDVIVVGSSLGGLATAALLARSGCRVLVLERRAAAGRLQSEESCALEFELEQSWAGMAPGSVMRMLIDQVTNAHVQWTEVDADFDSVCVLRDGSFRHRHSVPKGIDAFRDRLLETFPNEASAIHSYFDLLLKAETSWWYPLWTKLFPYPLVRLIHRLGLFSLFSSFFRVSRRSLQEVLDSLTGCEELKTLLSYTTLARGVSPREESFVAHALATRQRLQGGVFYPKGGYEEVVFRMASLIESAKGKVLVHADVVELLTNGKRVTGARVVTDDRSVKISAGTVIIAEGVGAARQLLPPELSHRAPWLGATERLLRPPTALFHLHLWLDREVGLRSQNVHLCLKQSGKSDEQALDEWLHRRQATTLPPFATLSSPSAKDPTWKIRQTSGAEDLLVVSFPGSVSWGPELKENVALRQRLLDSLWPAICRLRPGLEEAEVVRSMLRVEEEPSCLVDGPERFAEQLQVRLRPNFGPAGILLTGSDLVTAGLCGDLHGALLCASYHLNRGLGDELAKMNKGSISKRAHRIKKW